MKQRIFSHFQDYLIQYISHQYQDLLYCNSSQYILSTYNSQHNNNNNVVLAMTMPYSGQGLAMTMPYSGQGWRHSARPVSNDYANIVVRVEDIVHSPSGRALCLQPWPLYGIVIANTTLLLLLCWLLYVDKIYWELLQ
jgi:uracil DNA glycosylase